MIASFLNGKRTYILAAVTIALAVADAVGYAVPPAIYAVLTSLGLYTARVATARVS